MKQIILIEGDDAEDVDVNILFLATCGIDATHPFTSPLTRNAWANLHTATTGHEVQRTTEITIRT